MRLKTFIATYLLFLGILFSSVGIVSVHLTNSQMGMLREKSEGQFRTIAQTLSVDIAALYGRFFDEPDEFIMAVNNTVSGYVLFYRRQNIHINVTNLAMLAQDAPSGVDVSFLSADEGEFVHIVGVFSGAFGDFLLEYKLDISQEIADMQDVQNVLLVSAVAFSVFAAFAMYLLLSSIFKPLAVVAKASREIADGQFGERIHVKGSGEIAQVALDFNKMAERIESELKSKQQFVDNFAHEIRTPLTSIYGYAEYLQKAYLDEKETIESAGYIMDEASHMKAIANSLLELATLREYVPMKAPLNVEQLFDDIRKTLEKSLLDNNARLVCKAEAKVIYGQEDLVKSLLINLCNNAIRACTPDGEIRLESMELPNARVIAIVDNGCGIPPESLAKITEPFYRVDKSRSREDGGTGLGLTICSQIAKVHEAEMVVQSEIDVGTTVKIIFTNP